MLSKKIPLRKYGWKVTVFCGTDPSCSDAILARMASLNASDEDLCSAGDVLRNSGSNFGITYSNFRKRESVMVIGVADNPGEYFNTVVHESFHLSKHVTQCDGINPYSEEAAYITGDFVQKVYREFGDYLCLCGDDD